MTVAGRRLLVNIKKLNDKKDEDKMSRIKDFAEGFARSHNKEYRQFLYISPGSCAELETQIEIAGRLKYLSENSMKHLIDILQQLGRMLTSLIKCITENISFSTTRKNGSSSQVNQRPTPSAQRLSKSYQRPAPSDFQNNTSAQRPATENKQQAYE